MAGRLAADRWREGDAYRPALPRIELHHPIEVHRIVDEEGWIVRRRLDQHHRRRRVVVNRELPLVARQANLDRSEVEDLRGELDARTQIGLSDCSGWDQR